MTAQDQLAALQKIKKLHENLVVFGGIFVGFILLVYFFTFPQLIDRSLTGVLWFQGITTILAGFYFVYLKRISYSLTKMFLGRDPVRKQLLAALTPADLLKADDLLLEQFSAHTKGV